MVIKWILWGEDMKCQSCGNELPEDSAFCQYCGEKLSSVVIAEKDVLKTGQVKNETNIENIEDKITSKDEAPLDGGECQKNTPIIAKKPNTENVVSNSDITIHTKKEPPAKDHGKRYCKYCGGLIDSGTKKCLSCGRQYFRGSKKTILTLVIIVVIMALLGANIYQYVLFKQEQAAMSLTIKNQKTVNSDLDIKINDLENKADSYDDICNELSAGKIGYASNNFKSSESVIAVKQSETGRKFTLTANWNSGGVVDVAYSGISARVDFDQDSWQTSTTMSIDPLVAGITVVTFSNNVNSETFKIIVIVTE